MVIYDVRALGAWRWRSAGFVTVSVLDWRQTGAVREWGVLVRGGVA